jgi:putative ABC transport system substrate-binding protein
MSGLSRREFLAGTGAVAVAGFGVALLAGSGHLASQTEVPRRVARIGFLSPLSPQTIGPVAWFDQGLRELGYVEGQNISVEYRYGEGQDERLPDLAVELVDLDVDVILALGTPAVQAAKNTTRTIPIVLLTGGNPVTTQLVASFARPGGNVTGISYLTGQLTAKRLELLKESIPSVVHVAVLWNPDSQSQVLDWDDLRAAAQVLRVQLQSLEVRVPRDLSDAFEAAASSGAEALLPLDSSLLNDNSLHIVDFAGKNRLPAMYAVKRFVDAGGLMSYGPNSPAYFRRAAYYVDRILKGTKPADLPIEQPMTFDFVVNMKTARELGITFPNEIMLQVTEVIQ